MSGEAFEIISSLNVTTLIYSFVILRNTLTVTIPKHRLRCLAVSSI